MREIKEILARLELAAIAYGRPRLTLDADLVLETEWERGSRI